MDEKKTEGGKPVIDKEYLKRLAEKIKAEKAKKEGGTSDLPPMPPPPPPPPLPSAKPSAPPLPNIPQLADDDEDEGEGMAAEKTAIIDLASLSGQNADARIIIIDGKDEGKALELTRDDIVCGRSLDNDFVISDISVSRKHFRIVRDTEGFKVEDMGSGNGIRVNGKKDSSVLLYDGDLITAGARTVRFEYLNATLKEKFSRKKPEEGEAIVVKSRTSPVAWLAIILIIVVAAGGFYLFQSQQEQQRELREKLAQEDMLDRIDQLIEDRKFAEAEKQVLDFEKKYPGVKTRDVEKNKKLTAREKVNLERFEKGRKLFLENNIPDAEKVFREIGDDSIFYPEMVVLLGKETVEQWTITAIEELIKTNKTDDAVRKISALLVEDPTNAKANELMATLKAQIGAQKVETIQTTVVKEKEEQKKEVAEREKRKEELVKKGKIAQAPKPAPRPAPPPRPKPAPEPAPVSSGGLEYTMDDVTAAVDLYNAKDFPGAQSKLELILTSKDAKVKKRAADLLDLVKKFRSAYDKKDSKRAVIFDKRISGGKLKDDIVAELSPKKEEKAIPSRGRGAAVEDEFAVGGGGSADDGGSFDEQKAKTLYMEAVSLKESDPDKAREKFEEVIKITPKSHKYHKRAKKALAN